MFSCCSRVPAVLLVRLHGKHFRKPRFTIDYRVLKCLSSGRANVEKGTEVVPPKEAAVLSEATRVAQRVHSEESVRNRIRKEIWTVPNMITISRIVASPFLALAIVWDMREVALAGCIAAGISDWADGYIAKNYNQMTVLGGMLDPIADKVMIGCLTCGLALKGLLPMELMGIILGRDAILLASSFALRAYEKPAGAPYFDTTYSATFEITPSLLSKVRCTWWFPDTRGGLGASHPSCTCMIPLLHSNNTNLFAFAFTISDQYGSSIRIVINNPE